MTAEPTLRSTGISARIGDWLNPIVVKELRQAVQSRFVVAMLMVLLSIQLIAVVLYLLFSQATGESFDTGRNVFSILYGILLAISMLFVPVYTAVRLAAERSDTNVDLLFITTIKPRSIIAGKLMAAFVLTVLIFSACMPFMVFTYFLRGIDLPTIFILLTLAFLVIIVCAQFAILLASLPINRIAKVFLGVVGIVVLFSIFIWLMGVSFSMIRFGIGSTLGSWDFWRPAIGKLIIASAFTGLMFVLSVALITPSAANRALRVRLYMTIVWLITGIIAVIWTWRRKDETPLALWTVLSNSVFALALFVAVSERENLSHRVLRAIPQKAWKRFVAFFLFSGSASGLAWTSIMITITLLTAWVGSKLFWPVTTYDLFASFLWMGGINLYAFCYAVSGALVRRHLLKFLPSTWTWLIGAMLMFLGSVVPFLIGYLVFFNDKWWLEEYGIWLIGNPFVWGNKIYRGHYVFVGSVWAVIIIALSRRWFVASVRNFHPPNQVAKVEVETPEIVELKLS